MDRSVLKGEFAAVHDLVWAAHRGRLESAGTIVVEDSGRLAPLVELAMARAMNPEAYREVVLQGHLARAVEGGMERGEKIGHRAGESLGIFPLIQNGKKAHDEISYLQWRKRFQNAAVDGGCGRTFAAALAAVLGELVDNVDEHAGGPNAAIAGFRIEAGAVELVVADTGMGALNSLRTNPKHAAISDATEALRAIVHHGATRHPDESHHGKGIRQLFRTLVGRNGDLRFRSGDCALVLSGDVPLTPGKLESRSEAPLPGFSASLFCRMTTTDSGT